ncbi:MAG: CHAT domain-containing protein [Solirubrobacteraceae bacterium]
MHTAFITLERGPHGYEARLALDWDGESPPTADAPSVQFAMPVWPEGVEDPQKFLLQTEDPSPLYAQIGNKLHDALMAGPVGEELASARARGRVRLLLDVKPDELRKLPWELMRKGASELFLNYDNPIARVTPPLSDSNDKPEPCWPLRVLMVIGSRDGDKAVAADTEVACVRDAFRNHCGLVDLEVMVRPKRSDVRARVKKLRPHVFHFIGHGKFDTERGSGYLEMYQSNRAGDVQQWTPEELQADLRECPPRLAILNACHSGDTMSGTLAAADGLAGLGVPAIIAMQGPIGGENAAAFAKGFYGALVEGGAVDVAVARARVEIYLSARCDHAIPSLTLSADPERILHLPAVIALQEGKFAATRLMVDRAERRRQLWDLLRPNGASGARVCAITGPSGVGKGSLVRWCLGVSSIWGLPVAFVEFDTRKPPDSHGFLRNVAMAVRTDAFPGLNNGPLNEIDELLADFEARSDGTHSDTPPRRPPPKELYQRFIKHIAELTTERPLVIGIDGANALDPGIWRSYFVPHLIAPIVQGQVGGLRLILALDERDPRLDEDFVERREIKQLRLDRFPREEFKVAAVQYLRAKGYKRESFEDIVDQTYTKLKEPWTTLSFTILDLQAQQYSWPTED